MVLDQLDHIELNTLNDDWYKQIFSFAHDNEVTGEICPCYMALPVRGVRHVLNINPLMRILIVVRDPIDRLWSHMRMHDKSGYMALDADAIIDGRVEMGPYMRYTDYATALPRWEAIAGDGHVKVMLYDQIQENAHDAIDEINAFIGLHGAQTKAEIDRNVFSGAKMTLRPDLHAKLLEMLMLQYEFLAQRFPAQTSKWLERHHAAIESSSPAHSGI